MSELKTIHLRIPCCGLDGCQCEVDVPEYKISNDLLERILSDDSHTEMSTLIGVKCPICHSCYLFKPSKLKNMIIR